MNPECGLWFSEPEHSEGENIVLAGIQAPTPRNFN